MKQQRYKIPIPEEAHDILVRWATTENRTLSNLAESLLKDAAFAWEKEHPRESDDGGIKGFGPEIWDAIDSGGALVIRKPDGRYKVIEKKGSGEIKVTETGSYPEAVRCLSRTKKAQENSEENLREKMKEILGDSYSEIARSALTKKAPENKNT